MVNKNNRPFKEIGERLRHVRGELSQTAFSRSLGIKYPSQWNRYERGKEKPPRALLERIARQTGASIDWILTGKKHRAAEMLDAADTARLHGMVSEPAELYPGNAWRGEEEKIKSAAVVLGALDQMMGDMGLAMDESHRTAMMEYLVSTRTDRLGLYDLVRLLVSVGVVRHKNTKNQ